MSDTMGILIIGCGNMGGAMLAGWLAAGISPDRFAILDPALGHAPDGVALHRNVAELEATKTEGADFSAVLLGFKPQQLGQLAPGFQSLSGGDVGVYSLLAGLTLDQLVAAFPAARAHVRVMPNLAARINKSPIILHDRGLDAGARMATFDLFDALGTAVWLEDESQFNLVTALAGSGPGFVYRFIDGLAKAAQALGLEAGQATELALATVDGAAALAAQAAASDHGAASPGELADQVASPGGMTREGLNVLDDEQALVRLLTATLRATADRGAQLSAGG